MPSTLRVRPNPSEKRTLLRLREKAGSRRVWKRITALLLLSAGLGTAKILESLGISRGTLVNWKQRWLKRHHFGMEDAARSGRPPEVTPRYVKELIRVVRLDPRACGYAFTRWTAPRLAQYLFEMTGVGITPAWMSEVLRMHGFVWRKTKRTIRNLQNPRATERARKALRRLKKGLSTRAPISSCGSPMAFASSFCRSLPTPIGSAASR